MICSVFGHREITSPIDENQLKDIFRRLITERGAATFYFGGFGRFDDLCHKLVTQLKDEFPFIKRVYCCADDRYLRPSKRPKWLKDSDFEDFISLALENNWWYNRIYFRNCAMIDDSDFIIFYAEKRENSGAYKALIYAQKKKKEFINIFN